MKKKETKEIWACNTDKAQIKPKKQPLQLKKYFFTWNNYPDNYEEILLKFGKEFCCKYIWQREIGKCGTKHIQGGIWLWDKHRFTEFGLPVQIHWEPMRDEKKTIEYCSKDDETYDGGRVKYGFPKEIKIIDKLYPWQSEIEEIFFTEPDGRKIHWFYDYIGGKGKSKFCLYMAIKHKALVIQGGKLSDIMNIIFNTDMDEVNMVIIDVPRCNGNKVSYASIECILNGMITNTKFETGIKYFNPPHIVVFANSEPDTSKLSNDRWIIKEL